MAKDRSILDGVTLADERLQYALNGIKKAIAALTTGAGTAGVGVAYPIPYFPTQGATTYYWQTDNSTHANVPNPADPTNPGANIALEDYNKGTDEDNEDGGALVSWWLIPSDCGTLKGFLKAVKKNGDYGRKIPFAFDDIDDDERAAGFCERTIRGLRPKRVYDLLRATSKPIGGGAPAHNPISPYKAARVCPQPALGNTRDTSMLAWPNPAPGEPAIGYPPYGTTPHYPTYLNPVLPADQGEALARIDLRNYAPLNVRITAVGAAEKDRDGTYYPVTVTFTAGQVDRIVLRGFRVGRKQPENYALYGKTYRRWPFELSATDRDAGTAVLRVGPFGKRQAKQPWHITRIHAQDFKDDIQSKKFTELYPALIGDCAGPDDIGLAFAATPSTDLDSAYHKAKSNSNVSGGRVPGAAADGSITADTDDVSAGQATNWQNAQTSDGSAPSDGGASGARRVLAVLAPGEAVDGKLANFTVTTAPDLATEKDSDAYIRFSSDIQTPAGAASTAGDANATQAVFIFYRQADTDNRANYVRKRVDLNPTDAKAELTFHRKVGRKFHMKKMRLKNGISKVDANLSSQTGGGLTSGVFVAGTTGGAYTDTDAHTGISSVVLTDADSSNNESTKAHINAAIANIGVGGLPVIPKRALIYVSRKGTTSDPGAIPSDNPTTGDWRLEKEIALGDEPNLATVATVNRIFAVRLRRKKDHWIRMRLYVKGSSTPIDSSSLLYTSESQLPNNNYGHGHGNYVRGGGFLASKKDVDGSGSTAKPGQDWEVWSALDGTGAVDIDSDAADAVYWDQANRRLIWKYNGGSRLYVACKLPKCLPPGKRFTTTMRLRSNSGTSDSSTFIARICSKGVGSLTTPGLHRGVTLNANTGAYVTATSGIDLPNYATGTQGLYLVLDGNGSSDDQDFQLTDVGLFLGNQPLPWEPAGVEANWTLDSATGVTYTNDDAGDYANAGGGNEYDADGDTDWE